MEQKDDIIKRLREENDLKNRMLASAQQVLKES
jgi:hypothetical protein